MNFAFQHMRLDAPSLYALINTWAEMHLEVTGESAVITGYGYAHEIAEAFTTLILDWEAFIYLTKADLELEPGEYDLIFLDDTLFACRDQQKFAVADRAVVVEVEPAEKELEGGEKAAE